MRWLLILASDSHGLLFSVRVRPRLSVALSKSPSPLGGDRGGLLIDDAKLLRKKRPPFL